MGPARVSHVPTHGRSAPHITSLPRRSQQARDEGDACHSNATHSPSRRLNAWRTAQPAIPPRASSLSIPRPAPPSTPLPRPCPIRPLCAHAHAHAPRSVCAACRLGSDGEPRGHDLTCHAGLFRPATHPSIIYQLSLHHPLVIHPKRYWCLHYQLLSSTILLCACTRDFAAATDVSTIDSLKSVLQGHLVFPPSLSGTAPSRVFCCISLLPSP
jgi:hypothetical protein